MRLSCRRAGRSIVLAGMILLGTALAGCDRAPTGSAKPGGQADGSGVRPRNVLLITLDTTRADRLGCYGYAAARTPTLDALASGGTLFERAYCQVPLTLPSHASILTGKYPREFGVRDNGHAALGDAHETLATLARKAGLKTGAFVASFVLDARFGLARGFDAYDDEMKRPSLETKLLDIERPADVVTDAALAWLGRLEAEPFFCWVHYYDPHDPYAPPEPFRSAAPNAYDGELAFVDTQVKRLIDWLGEQKRRDETLIVVVGDHGESFGEHGVHGHTTFLHDTNLHVPLFFNLAGAVPQAQRIAAPVEIANVCRTVCELAGWAAPTGLLSTSLAGAFRGETVAPQECYAESHYVYNAHRWAEQRALVTERWKFISSTKAELFDLTADRGEMTNQISAQADTAADLRQRLLDRYAAMQPGEAAKVDDAGQRAIASLGYVSGAPTATEQFLTADAPDPKDMLSAMNQLQQAQALIQADKLEEALPVIEQAAAACPRSVQFQYTLGALYVKLQRPADAQVALRRALEIDPRHALSLGAMGDALAWSGDWEKAVEHYAAAAKLDDADAEAHAKLASAFQRLGRTDEAIAEYKLALERFPAYSEAAAEYLLLLQPLKRVGEGVELFQRLSEAHPLDPVAKFNLAAALLVNGQPELAAAWFREAIRLKSDYGDAHSRLGVALAIMGREAEAAAAFAEAKKFPDSAAEAWYNEGVGHEKGGRTNEAIEAFRQAVALRPDMVNAIVALTRRYLAANDFANAIAVLRAGTEKCPNELRLHSTLAELLATCEVDALRNGQEAVMHAERACQLAGHEYPVLMAALAAAYAEAGDFAKAREIATRARDLAEAAGNPGVAGMLAQQLAKYEQNQPIRKSKY